MKKYNYLLAFFIDLSVSAEAGIIDMASFNALPMAVVWAADQYSENSPTPNPVVSDFLILTGSSGSVAPDLIPGNAIPFLTGTLTASSNGTTKPSLFQVLNPSMQPVGGGVLSDNSPTGILDSNNSMTKFGINSNTRIALEPMLKKSFYVASNCPFNIYAQAGAPTINGEFQNNATINLTMSITEAGTDGGISYGSKAQSPSIGGAGFIGFPVSLASLTVPTKVYTGGRKTAAAPGNLIEQSVRFNIQYEILGSHGLELGISSLSIPVTYTIYIP